MSAAGVSFADVRRALVRAGVGSLLAVPAGLIGGSFPAFVVLSFAVATIPLSLAELAAAKRERVAWGWHVVVFVGALVLVCGGALEAAYAEGVYRTHSIPGALERVELFVRTSRLPMDDIGPPPIAFVYAVAIGVSLWAPFTARVAFRLGPRDAGLLIGIAFGAAFLGGIFASALLGLVSSMRIHRDLLETVFVVAWVTFITVVSSVPGTLATPIVYAIADTFERALWPAMPGVVVE